MEEFESWAEDNLDLIVGFAMFGEVVLESDGLVAFASRHHPPRLKTKFSPRQFGLRHYHSDNIIIK